MKNTIKLTVLVLCMAMLAAIFTACGPISGSYSAEVLGTTTTYEFSTFGNKVTKTTTDGSKVTTEELTYEISEDGTEITFFDAEGNDTTWSFEQGKNYIKMGVKTGIGDLGMFTYIKD